MIKGMAYPTQLSARNAKHSLTREQSQVRIQQTMKETDNNAGTCTYWERLEHQMKYCAHQKSTHFQQQTIQQRNSRQLS